MKILLYCGLAYLWCGLARILKDLNTRSIDRPLWALEPTALNIIRFGLIWWLGPIMKNGRFTARGVAFGLLEVLMQLSVSAVVIWASVTASGLIVNSIVFRIGLSILFFYIANLIVVPILQVPLMFLSLILSAPLDWLFPKRPE